MAALGFPIRVRQSKTIRIRTARSLAGPEAVKPWLERRKRIAAVVAGLYPPISVATRMPRVKPRTEIFMLMFAA
jgi:hypothetical protein